MFKKKAYHGRLRTSYRSILLGVRLLSTQGEAKKEKKTKNIWDNVNPYHKYFNCNNVMNLYHRLCTI